MNDQMDLLLEGTGIENQNIEVINEDDKTKHQQKIKKKNDEMKSDSPSTFDGLELNLNEDINDQKQETMVMNNVGATNVDLMTKNQRMVDTAIMEQNQFTYEHYE